MKTLLTVIVASFAMLGSLAAQANTPTSSPQNSTASPASQSNPAPPNGMRIAPGSVIPVQLTKTIDAKKVKPGDEVVAAVTIDLKAQSGEIIVPKNTKITGKVTAAQARSKQEKESQIGITFDHAVTKEGADVALPMSIQAVIARSYLSGSSGNNDNSNAQSSPQAMPQSSPSSGGMSAGGRSPGMQQPQPSSPPAGEPQANTAGPNPQPHPTITGQTQGVLGIQGVTLADAPNAAEGSLLTSDKNNVKLESGTLMLLRVNR